MMNIEIFEKRDQNTTKWSGGTTTELYITPTNSRYAERNFLLRISSATVEIEKSIFTELPNYDRFLMVLENNIRLQHKNQVSQMLQPFVVDAFDGADDTVSWGCCKDFNVMVRKNSGSKVNLQAYIHLPKKIIMKGKEHFFYSVDGTFILQTNLERIKVKKETLIHIRKAIETIVIYADVESTTVIHVEVTPPIKDVS
ncbi:Various environmental stresses-induced protein Ves [Propionispira arboris]|uniref:Various environmental stresses-induced protein Ves n=1 Tax=Propionispira arboris TaxID=84035 RepID=A0A1H7C4T4_9FIRM|nr:HutD family protein [Propionispira arboris]SEJ84304.1 Various environmental stresses-induced protein Ves [Propionispira arboris]